METFIAIFYLRPRHVKLVIPGILVAMLLAVSVTDQVVERALTVRKGVHTTESSAQSHFDQYARAVRLFASNPLLGVGSMRSALHERHGGVLRGAEHYGIHNSFLQVLAGQGLLGFIPFMAVFFISWRDFSRVMKYELINKSYRDLEMD